MSNFSNVSEIRLQVFGSPEHGSALQGFKILTSEQMWNRVECWFDEEVACLIQGFQIREECFALMQEEPN